MKYKWSISNITHGKKSPEPEGWELHIKTFDLKILVNFVKDVLLKGLPNMDVPEFFCKNPTL